MKVIGAGGDGLVYVDDRTVPKSVIKAIYKNNDACTKAGIEYDKQKQVYECFERLKRCCSEDPLVKLVNQYVRVAKALSHIETAGIINDTRYECSLSMSLLSSLPLEILTAFDPRIEQRIEQTYREQMGDFMAHVSLNSPVVGIFGVKFSSATITRENPPRGFFSNSETGFFQYLREKHAMPLSDEELERMMGFVYGWIYFDCGIIPLDIEFTLGMNAESKLYELNVLDFGMTFDKKALKNKTSPFETRRFLSMYGDTFLAETNEEDFTQRIVEDTGLDLYASMEEESESLKGFMVAKNLTPCAECDKLTSYVHLLESNLYAFKCRSCVTCGC